MGITCHGSSRIEGSRAEEKSTESILLSQLQLANPQPRINLTLRVFRTPM